VVYALSGLAVNHISDWDPSFRAIERTHQVATPLPRDPTAASERVLAALGVHEAPREVYASGDDALDLVFDRRTLHVTLSTGKVVEEGQAPRWFFRAANWLHLNRGKRAWTYVADAYAVLLLYLALSGLLMIPGRKGLVGRGAVLALVGAAVPVGYVVLSGGPEAKSGAVSGGATPPAR
jgi:hypothetical protein